MPNTFAPTQSRVTRAPHAVTSKGINTEGTVVAVDDDLRMVMWDHLSTSYGMMVNSTGRAYWHPADSLIEL